MSAPLFKCENLSKFFPIKSFLKTTAKVHAVDHVDLEIPLHQTYGLVGESGCGKSTISRTIMGITSPTTGTVKYNGRDTSRFSKKEWLDFRKRTSFVFQDPYSTLDPRMIIADVVGEPLAIHKVAFGEDREEIVLNLMELVGLKSDHMYRYPHEFSGGQRQRIAIARALAGDPEFILLDEATSALDVSVQAKILNLLNRLKSELNLTYLFISHNLGVIRYISDKVGVMYLGKLVEEGETQKLLDNPLHPYTIGLLAASPKIDPELRRRTADVVLTGEVPSAQNPPPGCRFHPRCPRATPICSQSVPPLEDVGEGHRVACFNLE